MLVGFCLAPKLSMISQVFFFFKNLPQCFYWNIPCLLNNFLLSSEMITIDRVVLRLVHIVQHRQDCHFVLCQYSPICDRHKEQNIQPENKICNIRKCKQTQLNLFITKLSMLTTTSRCELPAALTSDKHEMFRF